MCYARESIVESSCARLEVKSIRCDVSCFAKPATNLPASIVRCLIAFHRAGVKSSTVRRALDTIGRRCLTLCECPIADASLIGEATSHYPRTTRALHVGAHCDPVSIQRRLPNVQRSGRRSMQRYICSVHEAQNSTLQKTSACLRRVFEQGVSIRTVVRGHAAMGGLRSGFE